MCGPCPVLNYFPNGVEHIFRRLFAILIGSLVKCLAHVLLILAIFIACIDFFFYVDNYVICEERQFYFLKKVVRHIYLLNITKVMNRGIKTIMSSFEWRLGLGSRRNVPDKN